ncbi:MAG: DUF4097 family beta strand repeat-containing protein [Gemmatirosa sp.]
MTPTRSARLTLAAVAALPLAACGHGGHDGGDARSEHAFRWSGTVPQGGWVRIRDLNGSVRVARASGSEVVITASRRYRGNRPQEVRFVATPDAEGVTACAIWGEGTCTAERYESHVSAGSLFDRLFNRRSGVSVDYVVAIPAGVRVDAHTTNGGVIVADATSEVVARTTNGSVTIGSTGGRVSGRTVNGSVRARVDGLPAGASLELKSVNGSVTALLPANVDADVALETTNGRVKTDFPIAAREGDRRHLRGTLGAGGQRVSLETVNGSVMLARL